MPLSNEAFGRLCDARPLKRSSDRVGPGTIICPYERSVSGTAIQGVGVRRYRAAVRASDLGRLTTIAGSGAWTGQYAPGSSVRMSVATGGRGTASADQMEACKSDREGKCSLARDCLGDGWPAIVCGAQKRSSWPAWVCRTAAFSAPAEWILCCAEVRRSGVEIGRCVTKRNQIDRLSPSVFSQ